MTDADPFAVFGLDRSASWVEVRAARRRLAFDLHPDRGGDATAMQQVNAAFDACVGHLTGRRPLSPPEPPPAPEPPTAPTRPARQAPQTRSRRERWRDLERDLPSFTVNALPAETFEALLVVLSWIGELLDEEPPYLLECHLTEPGPCWCRLDIVPDAGGSTVSLTVARPEGDTSPEPVTAEAVRDVWVELLNQLGRPQP